jgi:hypothetical protein
VLRHSVSLLTLCPLGQPNKAIGHESQIERWLPHATVSLVALPKSNRVSAPPFPLRSPSQNGPRRQESAAPRRNGAPLTAPGRSAETFLIRGKGELGNLNDPASKHLATSPARPRTRYYTSRLVHRGLDAETFSRLPSRGRAFSLDILFYRTIGSLVRINMWSNRTPSRCEVP